MILCIMENKKLSRKEREQQIVKAARKVFIQKGYKGATTNEIADKAGISEVTLFRYFPSKQSLFLAAVEPLLTESLTSRFHAGEPPYEPGHIIRKFVENRIYFIIKNRELVKLVLMENQMDSELSGRVKVINQITGLLRENIEKMPLSRQQGTLLFRIIVGTLLSFLFFPEENEGDVEAFIPLLMKEMEYFFRQHYE